MQIIKSDILLVHPPHILVKEDYPIFPPPWNLFHVGSSSFVGRYPIGPAFGFMPIGFKTIKNFIESNSPYVVNILNLALARRSIARHLSLNRKTKDKSVFDHLAGSVHADYISETLQAYRVGLFAVDLHWLNSSQGAIEVLRLIKEKFPDSFTVTGGITATYFKKEIMESFPFIDFLIFGDGCLPLLKLIDAIKERRNFSKVPNILFRENGKLKSPRRLPLNDFQRVQEDGSSFQAIPTSRGCPLQCITCGGSSYASKKILNYKNTKVYTIDSIIKKISFFAQTSFNIEHKRKPFLIHDPLITMGRAKWKLLLNEVKRNALDVNFIIEFFIPHAKDDIFEIADKIPGSTIVISPESIVPRVRSFQRNIRYSNKDLISNINTINTMDSIFAEVWFMAPLAKDNAQSIKATLDFIRHYYKKIKNIKNNIIKYNELIFIDPGSLAYEFPQRYGYSLFNKDFLSTLESLRMPIYKYQINYRTKYYNREQVFNLFLYIHNQMNKIYLDNNVIDELLYKRAKRYNDLLKRYEHKYDRALLESDLAVRNECFKNIGNSFIRDLEKGCQE